MVSGTPRPHFTPGKTRYQMYRRLGGPQDRSGRAENLASPGFDPRTIQPIYIYIYIYIYIFIFIYRVQHRRPGHTHTSKPRIILRCFLWVAVNTMRPTRHPASYTDSCLYACPFYVHIHISIHYYVRSSC